MDFGRDNRSSFGGGPRESFKITCSNCGKEATVPFKPDGTRPVFCRDCYAKKKNRY